MNLRLSLGLLLTFAMVVSSYSAETKKAALIGPITQEALDLSLEPPYINTSPGPEYADTALDYAMVIGADQTPKGRIWAAWVAGGDSDRALFVAASSDDNGKHWSKPRLVIDPTDSPSGLRRRALVGNFWTDPTGRLWLFFDQAMGFFDGRAGVWAITCDNPDDDEPKWSAPIRIWHGATLCKPLVLSTGEWLLPVSLWTRRYIIGELKDTGYSELDDLRMANVFASTNQGKSWERRGGVLFPAGQFDEHMMIELKDGRIWMLSRTNHGLGESFSSDGGKTWSEPQRSKIQHTHSRIFIRRLASGRLILVKHGKIDEITPKRSHLTAFLSDDDGESWSKGFVIDAREGISYPDGFQSPDGTVFVIYDYNRSTDAEILMARFTEDDVLKQQFSSPGSEPRILVNKALGRVQSNSQRK